MSSKHKKKMFIFPQKLNLSFSLVEQNPSSFFENVACAEALISPDVIVHCAICVSFGKPFSLSTLLTINGFSFSGFAVVAAFSSSIFLSAGSTTKEYEEAGYCGGKRVVLFCK
jgi:hypothetical protein